VRFVSHVGRARPGVQNETALVHRFDYRFDMLKAIPDAKDQSAQLARMERLCSALDAVRDESERLAHEITAEARRVNAAITTANSLEAW
jgi:hypothetical protein